MQGKDWLSERVLFGFLIITGYLILIGVTLWWGVHGKHAELITEALASLSSLGTALGVIVAAIWKTDRTDKQTAEALNGLSQAVNTAMSLPPASGSQP